MPEFAVKLNSNHFVVGLGENTAIAGRERALAEVAQSAAAESAAFAEEFSGPAYATQAFGEAATTEGQFFRVWNGDTPRTYTRYQRTSGGSAEAAPLATTEYSEATYTKKSELAANDGAEGVGFKQYDADAVDQDLKRKANLTLHFADFIPAPMNPAVADVSSYITKAINALIARGGGTLRGEGFPSYRCDTALGFFQGSDIVIDLGGASLDFSNASVVAADTLLGFQGSYSTGVALTSNAAANQKAIAINSSGFTAGDFVRVYSEKLWDSTRTQTRIGELAFIETVPNGSGVTLTTELQDAYATADSAKIEKLTPVRNITLRNGGITGPTGNDESRGVRFRLGINCRIENVDFLNIDYAQAQLTDCVEGKVTGCSFETANHAATAYGLSFADACQDCVAYGNSFRNVRHSMSTNNNTSTSYGITRRIRFEMNDVFDSSTSLGGTGGDAIDTHAGSDDIDIISNRVHSSSGVGINCESRSARILTNQVRYTASVGIYFHPYADRPSDVTISGNGLAFIGDGVGTDPAIFVLPGVAAATPKRVTINGNKGTGIIGEAVRITGASGNEITNVTISGGNNFECIGASAVINLSYVRHATICGNVLSSSSSSAAYGLIANNCSMVTVAGNPITTSGTGSVFYGAYFTGTGSGNTVSGNPMTNTGSYGTTKGVFFNNSITKSIAIGNPTFGFTTPVDLGSGSGNVQANNT